MGGIVNTSGHVATAFGLRVAVPPPPQGETEASKPLGGEGRATRSYGLLSFGYIPFAIRTFGSSVITFATPPGPVAEASKHQINIEKVTLLPEGSWEKYTSIHKMGLINLWSCEGRRYIIAKEDLLTASCDSCQPFHRHHILAYRSVHTKEISVRNTCSKEFIRR